MNLLNFERECHNCNQDFLLTALLVCHGLSLLAAFAVAIRPGPDMGKSKDFNCTGFWLSLMPMPDIQTTSQSPLSLSVVLYFLFLKLVWWQGLICVRMTVGRMAVGRVIVGRMTVGRMTVVRMTVGRRMWGGECGEDDCGEDDCGEEMPEPQTTSQSPSFCSCCQSSQVSFLLSGATSSNSNSLRRFLDVSKLAVECMKGW